MIKTKAYGQLKSIIFNLDRADIMNMLRDGGHIPKEFETVDWCDEPDWPIQVKVELYEPATTALLTEKKP